MSVDLLIDIETRPRDLTDGELLDLAIASKKNPKRTDITRAAWASEPENLALVWATLSTSLLEAQIVAWAAIVDGGEVQSWADWHDEPGGLRRLVGLLDSAPAGRIRWCGHAVRDFDLPILRIAAMAHGIGALVRAIPDKPFSDQIFDTMANAGNPGKRPAFASVDRLARRLGVPGKGEIGKLDFPKLYADVMRGGMSAEDAAALLERRARVDVVTEWRIFERMTR